MDGGYISTHKPTWSAAQDFRLAGQGYVADTSAGYDDDFAKLVRSEHRPATR
jgi:hypothetical protein